MVHAAERTVGEAGRPVWLVRHGESTWNALGLVQGQVDGPRLTRRGTAQARRVARRLAGRPVRAIYSSDLLRAVQTARPLAAALGLRPVQDPRLRERCFGTAESTPSASLGPELSGLAEGRVADADAAPPGGESVRQLCRRVAGFLDELAADDDLWREPAGEVVLVAHGGVVRAALAHLDGVQLHGMAWGPVDNGHAVRRPLAPASAAPAPVPRTPAAERPALRRHAVADPKGAPMNETALRLPERAGKPRRAGVTMVVDGGLPLGALRDLVASAGEYVDFVKFGWGTAVVSGEIGAKAALLRRGRHRLLPGRDALREARAAGPVRRVPRPLPRASAAGTWRSRTARSTCPTPRRRATCASSCDEFTVISEVGYKDGTRSEKLMPRRWLEFIGEDLDAGATLVTLESRESGSSGICRPDGRLRIGLIEELLGDGLPADRLMFEAPTTTLQTYFVKRVGTDVNLGNVPATGVIGLETLRLGLRADTLATFEPGAEGGTEGGDW